MKLTEIQIHDAAGVLRKIRVIEVTDEAPLPRGYTTGPYMAKADYWRDQLTNASRTDESKARIRAALEAGTPEALDALGDPLSSITPTSPRAS